MARSPLRMRLSAAVRRIKADARCELLRRLPLGKPGRRCAAQPHAGRRCPGFQRIIPQAAGGCPLTLEMLDSACFTTANPQLSKLSGAELLAALKPDWTKPTQPVWCAPFAARDWLSGSQRIGCEVRSAGPTAGSICVDSRPALAAG